MAAGTLTADGRARVLADGNEIPLLGLGVWQVPEGRECEQAVLWALEAGYRHIDTAQAYGNEGSVGRALRDSGLPREDVFLTTKFYPGAPRPGGGSATEPGAARRRLRRPLHHPLAAGRAYLGMAGHAARPRSGATRARSASRTSAPRTWTPCSAVADVAAGDRPGAVQPLRVPPCAAGGVRARTASRWRRTARSAPGATWATGRWRQIAERLGRTPAQVLIRWSLQRGVSCCRSPRTASASSRTHRSSTSSSPPTTWPRSTRSTAPAAPIEAWSGPGGELQVRDLAFLRKYDHVRSGLGDEVGLPQVRTEHLVLDVPGRDPAFHEGTADRLHEGQRTAEVVGGVRPAGPPDPRPSGRRRCRRPEGCSRPRPRTRRAERRPAGAGRRRGPARAGRRRSRPHRRAAAGPEHASRRRPGGTASRPSA